MSCTDVHLESLLQVADEVGTPAHDLYVRTHGAYAPGEQRKRNYNWDGTGAFLSLPQFHADVPAYRALLEVQSASAPEIGIGLAREVTMVLLD